jgi:DNA polymerase III epsilon subunit-like protein
MLKNVSILKSKEDLMSQSREKMEHWQDNCLAVIDIETTGTYADWHEIIQLCILPLNSYLEPLKRVTPLNIYIMPEHPERLADELKTKSWHMKLMTAVRKYGIEKEFAKDVLRKWFKKLELPNLAFGNKKILPLGHNIGFDIGFIQAWLYDEYDDFFDRRIRDTMIVASFLNDLAAYHERGKVPYNKIGLVNICARHDISNEDAHDAMIDCIRTAESYKAMMKSTIF